MFKIITIYFIELCIIGREKKLRYYPKNITEKNTLFKIIMPQKKHFLGHSI